MQEENNIKCNLEDLFKAKKFYPNINQKKAIENIKNPLFLTAGPGSGKTRVLLWRVVNLIVFHDVKPDEIFLATFTEKAALQLKQGLQNLLSLASNYTKKPYDIAEMYVGTLHSLCQKLLSDRRFSNIRARGRRPIIMDDLQQYNFVYNETLDELMVAAGFGISNKQANYELINNWFKPSNLNKSKNVTTANLISFFNRMNEEDFDDEDLNLLSANDTLKALFAMTIKYRELLRSSKVEKVDFSSLQKKAFDYISSSSTAGNVFKYVIVDEYQDTNTIQQKIYMKLAEGFKNICVVGDDDQALYRFRGATVENLVGFEEICQCMLGIKPQRIDLNKNYRSRADIVKTYTNFIEHFDWEDEKKKGIFYRIQNKNICAFSEDHNPAVFVTEGDKKAYVSRIVDTIIQLKKEGKITDYNQCAILFPSLRYNNKMSSPVKAFAEALEAKGIPCYAPRAKNLLDTEECLVIFGLFAKLFEITTKIPEAGFNAWFKSAISKAEEIIDKDSILARFISTRQSQIKIVKDNYKVLKDYCDNNNIKFSSSADITLLSKLSSIPGLDRSVKRSLENGKLKKTIIEKTQAGRPLSVKYVLFRATALDWTLLDLFYQFNCFDYFSEKYKLAENGGEDAGMYNLGMITGFISKFMEMYDYVILSGGNFQNNMVPLKFFDSFLYMIFRKGETEYEDSKDPFPKGCVPFITIHQSKGLEFPVVILGSISHLDKEVRSLDKLVRQMQEEHGCLPRVTEPLEKMDAFDTMRMFYVALSRAKNLLIIAYHKGRGSKTFKTFKTFFDSTKFPSVEDIDFSLVPKSEIVTDKLANIYSYTSDYLPYKQCPRNYMVFHKYGFVPSRSQTMFFGSLVHRVVEDLQNYLAAEKGDKNE